MTLTMVGRLGACLFAMYRVPVAQVGGLVPRGLELLTLGSWAFWGIVMCRVEAMRPAGMPSGLGMTYLHVAHRLYVRSRLADGRTLDGLYFLRSEANRAMVCLGGNRVSDFHFHRARIALESGPDEARVTVQPRDMPASRLVARPAPRFELPADSCFTSVDQARVVLKYSPMGLSIHGRHVHLAEVFRDESHWHESPLTVIESHWPCLHKHAPGARLEMATRAEPIDYRWRLGRRERLV
ncbi:MAG: DUF2071 domain-containing protein [Phycisphaeraceae bacterium]